MPEQLTKQEVTSKTDPTVAKQWDDETPSAQKFEARLMKTLHSMTSLSNITL